MTMAWFSSRIPVAAMCVVVLAMASRNALAQTTSGAGTGFGANTVHHSRYTLRRRDHREQQQQPRGRRMTDAEMAYAFDHLRDLADDHEMSFSMNLGTNRFIEDPAKVAAVPHARAKGISAKSKSNDKGKSGKSDKESKSGSKQEKKKEKSGSSKAGSNKLKKSKGRRLRVESGAERARFRSSRIRADAATAATATASATSSSTAKGASSSRKSDRRLIGAGCTYEMGWTSSKEGSKDRSKEGSKAGSKSGGNTGGRGKDGGGRVGRDRGRRRIETGVFDCRTSGSFTCCREWGDTGDDELCCRTEAAPIGGNEQSNDGEDEDEDDNKNEKSGGAKRYSEDGEDEDADENKNENSGGAKRYSEDFFHLTDPDGPVPQIRPNLVDEESKSNDFPY